MPVHVPLVTQPYFDSSDFNHRNSTKKNTQNTIQSSNRESMDPFSPNYRSTMGESGFFKMSHKINKHESGITLRKSIYSPNQMNKSNKNLITIQAPAKLRSRIATHNNINSKEGSMGSVSQISLTEEQKQQKEKEGKK